VTGRRRRAVLLLGLALLLGALAASDVARREAAVQASLSPLADVVVARRDLEAGSTLATGDVAVRRMPARYAPAGAPAEPDEVVGRRVAVRVPGGGFLGDGMLDADADPRAAAGGVRRGERAVDVVGVGSPELVAAGARVDVLVTRGGEDAAGGVTELALEDVEVLSSVAAPGAAARDDAGVPRVAATLRVTVRQAVFLAAAQSFAREVRLLPRAPGDRRRAGGVAVGERLR
jgi:pilus assembly protein CpaB